MDLGTQISLDVLVSVGGGIIGAVGAYIKLKSKIDLQESKNIEQEREISDLKDRKKEMNNALHKRIDDQNNVIHDLQKEMNTGHGKLENAMVNMELRIVREIQNMVDKLTIKY